MSVNITVAIPLEQIIAIRNAAGDPLADPLVRDATLRAVTEAIRSLPFDVVPSTPKPITVDNTPKRKRKRVAEDQEVVQPTAYTEHKPLVLASGEGCVTVLLQDNLLNRFTCTMKRTTHLQKLMDSYAKRRGVAYDTLQFNAGEQKLNPDSTPKKLKLHDGDVIKVHTRLGGNHRR